MNFLVNPSQLNGKKAYESCGNQCGTRCGSDCFAACSTLGQCFCPLKE